MKEGCHVNAAGGNHWMRREIDGKAVERAGLIVVDDLEQAKLECGDLIWPAESGGFRWSMAHELKEVVSGKLAPSAAEGVRASAGVGLHNSIRVPRRGHRGRGRGAARAPEGPG